MFFCSTHPLVGTLEERAVNSGSGAWGDFETWQHGLFEMHLVRLYSCLGALMNRNLSKTMERRDLAVVTLNSYVKLRKQLQKVMIQISLKKVVRCPYKASWLINDTFLKKVVNCSHSINFFST